LVVVLALRRQGFSFAKLSSVLPSLARFCKKDKLWHIVYMKNKAKILVLFSGGLDSILVAKMLKEQGTEIELINFFTIFFGPETARQSAKEINLPLREVDMSEDFLVVLKKPKHGWGAGLNPCIDCHALMLKKAGQIMKEEGFNAVATGEVLGERPMSQNRQALNIVEKDAEMAGYLLRPLSAKLLEPTLSEKEGLIDREKMLDISGRRRDKQMAMAKEFGIKNYPSPGGGCALTQKGFAARLLELKKNKPDFSVHDAKLAIIGRHFWITLQRAQGILPERTPQPRGESKADTQIILGRDKEENEFLKSQVKEGEVFIIPINFNGPEALIKGNKISDEIINQAKDLIVKFAPKARELKPEELVFDIIRKQ